LYGDVRSGKPHLKQDRSIGRKTRIARPPEPHRIEVRGDTHPREMVTKALWAEQNPAYRHTSQVSFPPTCKLAAMRVYWQVFIVVVAAVGFTNLTGGLVNVHDNGTFGFAGQQLTSRASGFTVTAVAPKSPAAVAGIRVGDVLHYPPSFESRVRVGVPVPGDTVTFTDGSREISLTAVVDETPPAWALIVIVDLARLAFITIGVLIAWRRPDEPSARALALFLTCFGGAINYDLALVSPLWARFASFVLVQSAFLAGGLGVFAFACRFPAAATQGIRRWLERAVVPVGIFGFAVTAASFFVSFALTNRPLAQALTTVYLVLYLGIIVATLVALIVSYRAAVREQRPRMRWVIGTLALGFSGIFVLFIGIALNVQGQAAQALQYGSLTVLAIPFGLGYVILRHRVIDIGFVINRAVVYAVVSLVGVTTFIVFEWLIGNVVQKNTGASLFISVAGAIGLGFSIRYIHQRVDRHVDDFFFRERHAAEAAIRRFAHEAGLITDPDILVHRTVEIVQHNAKLEGAAFYARLGARFIVLHSTFSTLPRELGENDAAIVSMRTWHQPVDIQDDSEIPGICAFPLMVRGQLTGFLACGEKVTHEAFAPDESDAIRVLARDAGIALDSLRIARIERELAFLSANGELPEAIRVQLAALVAPGRAQL
jgi:hypothetical protein